MDALFSIDDDDIPASSEGALQHLVKLDTEGDYQVLYALVRCKSDSFSLQLTDTQNSWAGVLPHSQISQAAKEAKTSKTELLADTRRALTRSDMGTTEYIYTTGKRAGGGLDLTWKKHLISGNIKVQLGKLALDAQPTAAMLQKMLEYAVGRVSDQQQSIRELEIERERLVSERASALKQLEKTVLLKEKIEGDLYGKFMYVLNEKKAKIRRLIESLEHLSSQAQPTASRKRSAQTRKHGEGGGSDGTSDEEESDDNILTPSPKETSPDPIESLAPSDPGPSSLLQQDLQEGEASPPVKRKRRRETKKQPGQSCIQETTEVCYL